MPDVTLAVELGRTPGSRASGRLRAAGRIPAVVYGHGSDPVAISVDGRALRAALSGGAGLNALLSLDLGGERQLGMVKEIQRHPVRGTVSHVDIVLVNRNEVVSAEVPIVLTGEATELLKSDGVIDQQLFNLTIHATPGDIPNHLEVDVSELNVGDTLRVSDLALPTGATTDVDDEMVVVVGQPPQVSAEDLISDADIEAAAAEAAAASEAAEGGEGSEAADGEPGTDAGATADE